MKLTIEQGKFLVRFARRVIEEHFNGKRLEIPENMRDIMEKEKGVFVTLYLYPSHNLRGCMGYTEGIMPLANALKDVALSSAFKDLRFRPVRKNELNRITIEVSILTDPELIRVNDPSEYPGKIEIGRDGLIVENLSKGVILPQVAVEQRWNVREFLSKTCMKAGFDPDCWIKDPIKVYKFSAQIFSEVEPGGEVVEK